MIKEVLFQGLSHSPSDHESQEGELGTCLNLINEDGALHPIHQPVVVDSAITIPDGASIELIHKVTHDNTIHSHYIIRNGNTWYWTEKGGNGSENTIKLSGFQVNAVSAIGNILCFVGDSNTIYAYWNGSSYYVLDLSEIHYTITINDSNKKGETVTELGDDWNNAFGKDSNGNDGEGAPSKKGASIIFNAIDASFNKELENLEDYYFKYVSFAVAAVRLYDGSYINISNPFILAPYYIGNKFVYEHKVGNTVLKRIFATSYFHKHDVIVSLNIPNEIKDIMKDIIQGIDIFVTAGESFIDTSVAPRVINNKYNMNLPLNHRDSLKSAAFSFKSMNEVYETIDNASFYLSTNIDTDKFGAPVKLKRVKQTETSLSLSDFKQQAFGGKYSVVYNNRLHLANVETEIRNTYINDFYEHFPEANTPHVSLNNMLDTLDVNNLSGEFLHCDAIYHICISDKVVKKDIYYKGYILYPFQPMLAFPSTMATEMEVYYFNAIYSKYYKLRVALRQSESLGLSYYLNLGNRYTGGVKDVSLGDNTSTTDISYSRAHDDRNLPIYIQHRKYGYVEKTDGTYEWDKNSYTDTKLFNEITKEEYNRVLGYCQNSKIIKATQSLIKVSEAENPMVFPAKNSVQVGSSIINALAANTRPISEGQFGEAPLYAFTDEGVWVLMTNQEGTYDARQPANRDICSNHKGILQIDDAVLFPTERGIMMQRGRDSECITDVLDGYPFVFTQIFKNDYQKKLLALGGIPESDTQYIRFRTFLQKASLIYDYYDNRIIVFRPDYTYAYVYSLKSRMWGTMHNVFRSTVNSYPKSYAINQSGKIVDVYIKEPSGSVSYFFCTRPLTLGQENIHKTMFKSIIRGYFRNVSKGKVGVVLYGSNDLFNWFYIHSSVNQLLAGMAGSPYKYFRFAVMGSLNYDESIHSVGTEFVARLQNKLR